MAMLHFTKTGWKRVATAANKVASRSELPAVDSALFEHLRARFWESMQADAYGLVDLELSNEAKLRLNQPQHHGEFKAWMDAFLQPPSDVRLVEIGTLPTQSPFPQVRSEGPSHMGMLELHTDGGRAIHLTATMSTRGLGTQVLMTGNRSREEVARAVNIANDALAAARQGFAAIDGLWADAYRAEIARRANGADAWFAHQWERSFIAEEGELLAFLNPVTENAELFRETGGVIHRRPTELIIGTPRVLSVYRGKFVDSSLYPF